MGSLYVFARDGPVQKRINALLSTSHRLVLLLDYDGTLVPIKKTPSRAVLSNGMRDILRRILRNRRISLGLVTGRTLSNIRRLVRLRGLFLIANHGLETRVDNKTWVHPRARRISPVLDKTFVSLKKKLNAILGVFIEHKQYSLTVHYRNVPAMHIPMLKRGVKDSLSPSLRFLRTTGGKKVFEIRPSFSWGKGRAVSRVLRLMRFRRKPAIIYIGDDTTDEDAFRVLKKDAVTIRVGLSRNTKAKYFVHNIFEVERLLETILVLYRIGMRKTRRPTLT